MAARAQCNPFCGFQVHYWHCRVFCTISALSTIGALCKLTPTLIYPPYPICPLIVPRCYIHLQIVCCTVSHYIKVHISGLQWDTADLLQKMYSCGWRSEDMVSTCTWEHRRGMQCITCVCILIYCNSKLKYKHISLQCCCFNAMQNAIKWNSGICWKCNSILDSEHSDH